MSHPSSPVLKARRQTHRLYSRMLYGVLGFCFTIWLVRAVFFRPHARTHVWHAEPKATTIHLHNTVYTKEAEDTPTHTLEPNTTSLSVILPVTADSLLTLDSHLHSLLGRSPALSEVVLLSAPSNHPQIRKSLRRILSRLDPVDVELSISHWQEGIPQSTAVIRAAQRATTDWVLLADEDGLLDQDAGTCDTLLLTTASPTMLPFGPRGLNFGADLEVSPCLQPGPLPQKAPYLVPPFTMPTHLLPALTPGGRSHYSWSAIGDHVSAVTSEYGSGGLVVGSSDASSSWCRRYAPRGASVPQRTRFQEVSALGAPQVVLTDVQGTAAFLLVVHANDTRFIARIACGLARQGHRFSIASLLDPEQLAGRESLHLEDCLNAIDIVDIPLTSLLAANDILDRSLTRLPDVLDVVISTVVEDLLSPLLLFLSDRAGTRGPATSIVRLEREDLPYCDWMAGIGLDGWKNWHIPRIELAVITDNRPHSLRRLLTSMSSARYFGDKLDLRFHIEQTADEQTLSMTSEYKWAHGGVSLHHRVVHGGLMAAVVECWYPRDNDSYTLILEDDVELSPLFYAWTKMSLLQYRYGRPEDRSPLLFGISLYQQKNLELHPDGRRLFDARAAFSAAGLAHTHTPYLSQIPCSWGALYFPEHWREFHAYLVARRASTVLPLATPVVPAVRSNRWTRSWKKYFIELVFLRGYLMLYPNYAAFASLSTNHLEAGSHVRDMPPDAYARKRELFTVPLVPLPAVGDEDGDSDGVPATGLLELPGARMPPWDALPVLDLLGTIQDVETLQTRGSERRTELMGCDSPATHQFDVNDLLCINDE